jgi:hypothetical protein
MIASVFVMGVSTTIFARLPKKIGRKMSHLARMAGRCRVRRRRELANLLEVVVMITAEGNQLAIHAMPMRDKYERLLEP